MTLRLIITRHAKSSWANPELDDHDRPLNKRGKRNAGELGDWLKRNALEPDTVLCSSARRARETVAGVLGERREDPIPALYNAGPHKLLAVVKEASGGTVLLVAHNPGIGEFAQWMCAAPPEHPEFDRYPTGATTVLEFDAADWSGVAPGSGRESLFVIPREL